MKSTKISRSNSNYVRNLITTPLFSKILFGTNEFPEPEFNDVLNSYYFKTTPEFGRLSFHNNPPDMDDQFYIFETVNDFQLNSSYFDKISLSIQFLNSSKAHLEIESEIENGNYYDELGDTELDLSQIEEQAKSKLLKECISYADNNNFSPFMNKFLADLCTEFASEFDYSGVGIDSEQLFNYLTLYSLFE